MRRLLIIVLMLPISVLAAENKYDEVRALINNLSVLNLNIESSQNYAHVFDRLEKSTVQIIIHNPKSSMRKYALGSGFFLNGNYTKLYTAKHVLKGGIPEKFLFVDDRAKYFFKKVKLTLQNHEGKKISIPSKYLKDVMTYPAGDSGYFILSSKLSDKLKNSFSSLKQAKRRPYIGESIFSSGFPYFNYYEFQEKFLSARGSKKLSVIFDYTELTRGTITAGVCMTFETIDLIQKDAMRQPGERYRDDYRRLYESQDWSQDPLIKHLLATREGVNIPVPLIKEHTKDLVMSGKSAYMNDRFCGYNLNSTRQGASGGPIVNLQGELVGLTSEIALSTEQNYEFIGRLQK